VAHQAKEEARFLAAHRLEAHLVDHQEARGEVLLSAQARTGEVSVAFEGDEQILEPGEVHAETLLDGLDAEGYSEMGLAHAGRPLDEQRAVVADPLAGGEGLDATALDAGLEAVVEAGQGLAWPVGRPDRRRLVRMRRSSRQPSSASRMASTKAWGALPSLTASAMSTSR
jgi:hypothetical protein